MSPWYGNAIIDKLEKSQGRALDNASQYLVKKIKAKLNKTGTSKPGEPPAKKSGNLIKGTKFVRRGTDNRLIGFGPPAQAAHLMEFGTRDRVVQNYMGKKGVVKNVGKVEPRPFFLSTCEEERENVEKVLSEKWL
jgi:hypothetical protein